MMFTLIDLRQALERGAIAPFFQPIVELRTGRLAGFEVLARWQHPEHGLILPQHFISLAEKNELIGELTHTLLRKAFALAPVLPEPLFLAVNISPIQLRHFSLPRQIQDAADNYGFPLRQLTLEITESALVNNLERARKIAIKLRDLGCQLALDDFGTGYSSLRHLQALPFNKLKIDRSFVQSMTSENDSRKIVAAVVGLGYSLGMISVAEGVETEEQADALLWLGCDLGQGWLFGRPLPVDSVPELIASAPRTMSTRFSALAGSIAVAGLDALPAQRLAQLQAIYDGAPVGLCFLDKSLRYISLNQRLADMNGAPVAAHVGRTVSEMIPKVFPAIEPYLRRALTGEVIPKVKVLRPANGPAQPERTVLVSYQPVLDEARDVIGISLAILDWTQL
jgi:EAL domain-containing protein (putative c-di-GMP-specific phosphodiesterase class I)